MRRANFASSPASCWWASRAAEANIVLSAMPSEANAGMTLTAAADEALLRLRAAAHEVPSSGVLPLGDGERVSWQVWLAHIGDMTRESISVLVASIKANAMAADRAAARVAFKIWFLVGLHNSK